MQTDNILEVEKIIKKMFCIRFFEESLDALFDEGSISGTYHTCLGQEATCVGVVYNLNNNKDFVVSNHRNHGHYLAFSEDYRGLLEELKGTDKGVTGGRGGSQVIFGRNFLSTGILGSTVGVATGIALGLKIKKLNACVVCFMGDGALGEGIVYESFNMASLWSLPILFVLEHNHIAQSTDIDMITAGSIKNRFECFNIETTYIKSTNVFEIIELSSKLISIVKGEIKPLSLIVDADRLGAHSKGDDDRPAEVIRNIKKDDPLLKLIPYTGRYDAIKNEAYDKIQSIIK